MAIITRLTAKSPIKNLFGKKLGTFHLNINSFFALLYRLDSAQLFLSVVGKQPHKKAEKSLSIRVYVSESRKPWCIALELKVFIKVGVLDTSVDCNLFIERSFKLQVKPFFSNHQPFGTKMEKLQSNCK